MTRAPGFSRPGGKACDDAPTFQFFVIVSNGPDATCSFVAEYLPEGMTGVGLRCLLSPPDALRLG